MPDDAVVAAPSLLVSIVVVTYGTGPIILDALDAVDHEVIVVDCLPADPTTRTAPLLVDRTGIRLLAVDDNLGFAGGNECGWFMVDAVIENKIVTIARTPPAARARDRGCARRSERSAETSPSG